MRYLGLQQLSPLVEVSLFPIRGLPLCIHRVLMEITFGALAAPIIPDLADKF